MKSLAELEVIKKKAQLDMATRKENHNRKIVVAMGTCGIAAGARPVMNTLVEELKAKGILDASVVMNGEAKSCGLEPVVEIFELDGSKVTYGKVDSVKAKRIVEEHIVNGKICQDLLIK